MKTLAMLAATALLAQDSVILPYYPENLVWPDVPPSAPKLVVTNHGVTNLLFTNIVWNPDLDIQDKPLLTLTPKEYVELMCFEGTLTNVVNYLATNGTFCVVRGHIWLQEISVFAVYDPSVVGRRRCGVCKLYQEQRATEWK